MAREMARAREKARERTWEELKSTLGWGECSGSREERRRIQRLAAAREPVLVVVVVNVGAGGDDWIRLLRLEKGTGEDPVHGTMLACRLSAGSRPDFKALSYRSAGAGVAGGASASYGGRARNAHMFLGEYWLALPVSATCLAALRCFRRPDAEVVLWVDAICIDQRSAGERGRQLLTTDTAYAASEEVPVYVGGGEAGSAITCRVFPGNDGDLFWDYRLLPGALPVARRDEILQQLRSWDYVSFLDQLGGFVWEARQ
ncbi:hypothetical protein B0H63DRAFT_522975 [Podospora didyma]|uniref:Heterokaryon incompatibility domain-containing protein n=1 Tax=Podospora didyma TaxID=330526 RepID=A0AAE0NQ48_9PEZI|nr:hypothetical protein B0H63DRAFT_522975 [Podospora didyma]